MKAILLLTIAILISVIWINVETISFMETNHVKEVQRLTDSLSKANGLIKEYKKFYPEEK